MVKCDTGETQIDVHQCCVTFCFIKHTPDYLLASAAAAKGTRVSACLSIIQSVQM